MAKRTDPHRPGAIIPANYESIFSFSLSSSEGGWPVPSLGINCELDGRRIEKLPDGKERVINGEHRPDGNCCVIGLRQVGKKKFALGGGPGKCTVCGAHYIHGDAWLHIPTGEVVFLGHDCADKYEMLADRSEHELRLGNLRAAAAREAEKMRRAEVFLAFCSEHDGLNDALSMEHYILIDLREKLRRYGAISAKQVSLALKIASELKNPESAEVLVPAPVGDERITFQGLVIAARSHETRFGDSFKMTVKVTTPAGTWLAWGTAPSGVMTGHGALKGSTVEVTAKLKQGREPHFAIMQRPAGRVLKTSCPPDCLGCSVFNQPGSSSPEPA